MPCREDILIAKLLIVDDEKGITDSLRDFFEQRGFGVRTAGNGKEALEAVGSERPDIVFLDVQMNGINGIDVLDKIKKMDKTITVIMLTVHDEKELIDTAKRLGAEEYILKPFRVGQLEDIVMKKMRKLLPGRGMKNGG